MHDLIGHTPMVRISDMGVKPGVNVFAKLELYNPSGSVKDRTGWYMVRDAEQRGILKKGGTIIEGTAGNTGLGIAFAALGKGYRVIFVVPDKFSMEKQTLMRALGAEIVNTANGREEPDTKNFAFTKVWRDMLGESALAWPSGISITVTIQQDENEYAKYTITSADLQENNEISAVGDSAGSKAKLIVRTSKTSGYVFSLTGLPWGDSDTGYTYRVSEETVAGFQPPKYFSADGEQAMGASRIEDGGMIMNDEVGYELPATGGPGTGLFRIPGLILAGLAGALLVTRRRRRV